MIKDRVEWSKLVANITKQLNNNLSHSTWGKASRSLMARDDRLCQSSQPYENKSSGQWDGQPEGSRWTGQWYYGIYPILSRQNDRPWEYYYYRLGRSSDRWWWWCMIHLERIVNVPNHHNYHLRGSLLWGCGGVAILTNSTRWSIHSNWLVIANLA